jgi:hypothetical protein
LIPWYLFCKVSGISLLQRFGGAESKNTQQRNTEILAAPETMTILHKAPYLIVAGWEN